MSPTLMGLPYDILMDQLLPILPVSALLAMTCTSKYFAKVCSDPVLWKRRLQSDFNFSASDDTARTTGFKMIYKGMHRPKVYMWGDTTKGRLGLDPESLDDSESIPLPTELRFNRKIVSMVSGGWSFQALDDLGAIHVWGTMHAEVPSRSPPDDPWFAEYNATAWRPTKLIMPARIVSITCSRRHSAALDALNRVWVFTRWGRPSLLTYTGSLTNLDRHQRIAHTKIIQVECGWTFTSFLTADGSVFIIWPTSGTFAHQEALKNAAYDSDGDGNPAKAVAGVIQCIPVEISAEPLVLPDLPEDLPHLRSSIDDDGPETTAYTKPKLVRIAAGDEFIIGLTNQGHVLCIDVVGGDQDGGPTNLQEMLTSGERRWVYMPEYCDIRNIVEDSVYTSQDGGAPQVVPPKVLNITHISAHYNSFVAYSPGGSSTVLMASVRREQGSTIESIKRTIHPILQNEDIISVVIGDFHFGALHGNGTLYTWGGYMHGALGLGDPKKLPVGTPGGYKTQEDLDQALRGVSLRDLSPPGVDNPTPVRFDWDQPGRRRFCFSVAAAGWHCGALVFELEDDVDKEEAAHTSEPSKEKVDIPEEKVNGPSDARSNHSNNSGKGSKTSIWKRLGCGCFGV
ncbi:hypothetical protein FRC03_000276 [Tulasnella sp. 419]|nr:hypothetical protein FRC03_000276 [Tulasnella sp. 419]